MWERFEELRALKGVSAYEVAKACGFGASVLSSWKKGRYTPKDDKMRKIADYFGVPVEYLRGDPVQTNEQAAEYPVNEDAKRILQMLAKRPDIMKFVQAAEQAAPEDVTAATDVLLALIRRTK